MTKANLPSSCPGGNGQPQASAATVPECVDLQERFGDQYRVRHEESYYADHGDKARSEDAWLLTIPCHYGHVYPFGGNLLAASVDGHPNVAGVLRRLPCCRVHQDGDFGELTAVFDVADFATVAESCDRGDGDRCQQLSGNDCGVWVSKKGYNHTLKWSLRPALVLKQGWTCWGPTRKPRASFGLGGNVMYEGATLQP